MPVRTERRGRTFLITLDRPAALNAIDGEMYGQLVETWRLFDADEELAVAVVTGAGNRAFCTGRDLVSAGAGTDGDWSAGVGDPASLITPDRVGKPVIAAVNGHCLAGGFAIALACDLRLASENATFGTVAVKRGLVAAAGQIQRLVRYVPFGVAMELILMGERIDAHEAYRVGLVNRVLPPAELLPTALKWAERLAENGPLALRKSKQAAYEGGLGAPFREGLELEARLYLETLASEDAAEGVRAFAEKRPPRFRGR